VSRVLGRNWWPAVSRVQERDTEGPAAILPTCGDRGAIYKNLRAYSQKGKE
jgi:hypothetical protein